MICPFYVEIKKTVDILIWVYFVSCWQQLDNFFLIYLRSLYILYRGIKKLLVGIIVSIKINVEKKK